MPIVHIDCKRIRNVSSFHEVFAEALGFPGFYGRNMSAWIDCMSSLDSPGHGMTSVHCSPPEVLTLALDNAHLMPLELFQQILDSAAFVNWRRMEQGEPPVLAVSGWRR